jgi:hypothetical protein
MILASLVWLCFTRGYNPHFIPSQRVGDDQQAALHHANKDQTLLPVILSFIDKVDGERIIEGIASLLEIHAVLGEIGSSLRIIPFEVIGIHNIYGLPVVSQGVKA